MNSANVPISRCHINCSSCGLPTEFQFFESGPGGDFATFLGVKTGNFYRLDLAHAHYAAQSKSDLLVPAIELEGGLENLLSIPDQLQCKFCGKVLPNSNIAVDGELTVNAFLV